MDPRLKDSIREAERVAKENAERLDRLEELMVGMYKLIRSTNEAAVRKFGGEKVKNTAQAVATKIEKELEEKKK